MTHPVPPALRVLLDDPALLKIFSLLNSADHSVRLVGGVVRNVLMQRPVTDIDMATTHLPETVMEKARQAGLKVVPTGLAHGTVTLVIEGRSFEVTTLREDIETHGRHATVRFGHDFKHDALRRDFTINALYADADGHIYDYAEGLEDIEGKHVRFIGEARTRITEDYLRILRFFRFFSDYAEGPIDQAGLEACIAMRDGLGQLSRERIGSELVKILMSRRAHEVVQAMDKGGILALCLNHARDPDAFERLVQLAPEADAMTRLYALTNPDIEAAQALRKGLRLSNLQSALIEKINRALLLLDPLDDPVGRRHAAFRFGHEAALAALMLAASRTGGDCKQGTRHWLDEASADIRQVPLKSPFTGQHLLARGLQSGPQIGAIVGEAERLWIEEGLSGDPTIHNSQLERAVKHILD
jgi:poly(A) polymerase